MRKQQKCGASLTLPFTGRSVSKTLRAFNGAAIFLIFLGWSNEFSTQSTAVLEAPVLMFEELDISPIGRLLGPTGSFMEI